MGLSCTCEYDELEPGMYTIETGKPSVPPQGELCIECNAVLPAGEKSPNVRKVTWELIDEDDEPPSEPSGDDMSDDEHELAVELYEAEFDDWARRVGYCNDTEMVSTVKVIHRCERCCDLTDAIEGLGFCSILPGELIDAHQDYVEQYGKSGTRVNWRRDENGVWDIHNEGARH